MKGERRRGGGRVEPGAARRGRKPKARTWLRRRQPGAGRLGGMFAAGPPACACRPGSLRRIELGWAPVLLSLPWACGAPPAPVAERGEPRDDDLWIAVAEHVWDDAERTRRSLRLVPVARQAGGAWLLGWMEPQSNPFQFAVDSTGRVRREAVMSALPLDRSGPGPPRIAAPASWRHYRPPGAHAAGQSVDGVVVRTTGLVLVDAYCMAMGWKLSVQGPAGYEHDAGLGPYDLETGVALSRGPDEVLSEADLPELAAVREQLGLVSRDWPPEGSRSFDWVGLFRFGSLVLGVMDARYWEGHAYMVVEIDGARSRIVADLGRGGC